MAGAAADPSSRPADAVVATALAERCRNCGAVAEGAFCAACGQETTLALPTARQFLKEAAGRYVAFDGRMWRTLGGLLFHPGFLTREYLAGRRRRYIRPSRLFLVLSLLMFAVLRLTLDVPRLEDGDLVKVDAPAGESKATSAPADIRDGDPVDNVRVVLPGLSLRFDDNANLVVDGADGPLAAELKRRLDRFNAMPRQDKIEQLFLGVMRYGPYAMFVLLPAFALLLAVTYAARGKRYPARPRRYAEHLVFAAHNHAFFFLAVTLAALAPWRAVPSLLALWALVYALWSMQAVYQGRWIGVLARAWLIGAAYAVLFTFVTVGLVLAAVIVR